jgi:hypothetical protein
MIPISDLVKVKQILPFIKRPEARGLRNGTLQWKASVCHLGMTEKLDKNIPKGYELNELYMDQPMKVIIPNGMVSGRLPWMCSVI